MPADTPKRKHTQISPKILAAQNAKMSRQEPLVDVSHITEAVMTRVNEAMNDFKQQLSDPTAEGATPFDLISKMMVPMIGIMTTAITAGVAKLLDKGLEELNRREETRVRNTPDKVLSQLKVLTYKNDRLEQYTRRENIRINGVTVDPEEDAAQTQAKAIAVMRKTGADVVDADISACHRVGKLTGSVRPIIVRFVSRAKRQEVMRSKKNLKGMTPKVYVNDDLTTLRARLLGYVKGLSSVDSAWTIDGRIFAKKKLPPGLNAPERPVIIESPDDLFRLGEDSVDLSRLGLGELQ